jgi:pimeloyl-ACP methyl ester carboxylesterase
MKTSLERIYASDNLELVGLLHEPDAPTDKVLVHVHGMAGNFFENKFLDNLAETLTANGIAFFACNNRGTEYIKDLYKVENGMREYVRYGDSFEKFEDCILDIRAAIDAASQWGFKTVHLSGHSLGAPKVAFYITETKDPRIASIIFLSPADMVGLAKADKDYERDVSTATKMVAGGRGDELMPFIIWGESYLSARAYLSISGEESQVAIFNLYRSDDSLPVLSRITLPTLVVMGKKDGALTVPVEELMNRVSKALLGSPTVETKILGDADHQYNNYQQVMADTVLTWIQKM